MASNHVLTKNAAVDAAGMRPLTADELQGFAGIEGEPSHARIGEVEIFGGVEAQVVLCDSALGLYYADENDDLHGWQANLPRFVLELVAVELLKWDERHPGHDLNEDVLQRFGFESAF